MVILGDFNVNYNLRHTSAFKLLKSFEREFNLTQLIQRSTRNSNISSTCRPIDLIFTNMEHIISSGILSIMISDHLPIFLIKKKQKQHTKTDSIKCRSYATYRKQKYQEEIKVHPKWTNFWEVNKENPGKMWNIIKEVILEKVNEHCPYRNVKIKDDTPQWMTREILSELRHKDYLYNKAKKSKTERDWKIFKQKKKESERKGKTR